MPPACRFEPRCPYAWDLCSEKTPELYQAGRAGQQARCHLHTPGGAARLPEAVADHERKMNVGQGIA
jgi:putative component of membrane protein insertase Oxa1/YidC/SpoIIIJ protein YidD